MPYNNGRMGLSFGLEKSNLCMKTKYRWLFYIPEICSDHGAVNALPPLKSGRPSLDFKELEAQHLTETVYFPGKINWKPVNLTLFDLKKNTNPIFDWLKRLYEVEQNSVSWKYPVQQTSLDNFKLNGSLELYNGCGTAIEGWQFQNIWPQSIDFGELDMGNSDFTTIDVILRYDRAVQLF